MDKATFILGMERLVGVYGNTYYPRERKNIIWGRVKGLSNEKWIKILDYLIATRRTPPLLGEIDEAIIKVREASYAAEKSRFSNDVVGVFSYRDSDKTKRMMSHLFSFMNKEITREELEKILEALSNDTESR